MKKGCKIAAVLVFTAIFALPALAAAMTHDQGMVPKADGKAVLDNLKKAGYQSWALFSGKGKL